MKLIDIFWGIALTITMYAILTTLGYQVVTNEDLRLSVFLGATFTLIGRFGLGKALQGVEADFNIYREAATIAALIVATFLIYE